MSLAIFSPESLRWRSKMEICKNLWAQYRMRQILKENLMEVLMQGEPDHEALTQIYTNIDKLPLPKNVKDNLKTPAKTIGLAIWRWLDKLKSEPDTFSADLPCYIDYLKWTSDWTIDSAETVRSMYYSKVFSDTKETWAELSSYCLKDCLADFFGRVKLMDYDWFQSQLNPVKLNSAMILSFYWAKFMQNRLDECAAHLDSVYQILPRYDTSATLDTKMIFLFEKDNGIARKYFWQKQANTEKWSGYPYFYELLSWQGIDLIVYKEQYNGVSSLLVDRIINDGNVMEKIVYSPWEDLVISTTIFRTLLSALHPREVAKTVLTNLGKVVKQNRSWNDDDAANRIPAIFNIIWSAMDDETKGDTLSWWMDDTVIGLFGQDECLKIIFQDRALSGNKTNCLISIAGYLCRFVYNSTAVERFCAEILSDDEDRQHFMGWCNLHGSEHRCYIVEQRVYELMIQRRDRQ